MKSGKKGISLIVLVVTIVVIIILAVAVIVTMARGNAVDNAREAKLVTDIGNLREGIQIKKGKNIIDRAKGEEIVGEIENKLFGEVEMLGENYEIYKDKFAIENDEPVYKEGAFNKKQAEILEKNGVEKESKYYIIMNEKTREEKYKEDERVIILKELQEKITSGEFSGYQGKHNKAYIIENLDLGAKWNEEGILLEGEEWIPITSIPENTILDGCGKTISGMYINATEPGNALIDINNGIIKKVKIGKINYITSTNNSTAAVCVYNYGSIIECENRANITSKGGMDTAGICVFNREKFGGNKSIIEKCNNYGAISGGYYVSGICAGANNKNGEISYCINYGNVNGQAYGSAGILGGSNSNVLGIVKNCINYGNIRSNSNSAAGIVDRGAQVNIENCINFGDIYGCYSAAGIAGSFTEGAIIKNCYNVGNVSHYVDRFNIGGIVCTNIGIIENCYNIGQVFESDKYVGNYITKENQGEIINSYYLGEKLENNKLVDEDFMKSEEFAKMLGEAYSMDTENKNNGYPILKKLSELYK